MKFILKLLCLILFVSLIMFILKTDQLNHFLEFIEPLKEKVLNFDYGEFFQSLKEKAKWIKEIVF